VITRGRFLTAAVATAATAAGPATALGADEVPSLLDHIILGCSDLDTGIAFVERSTGVRAAYGGVHPGGGTRNALVALGGKRYLEILAPDPSQTNLRSGAVRDVAALRALASPKLLGWAVHPGNIEAFVAQLRQRGIAIEGPVSGSRKRPDGTILKWKTAHLVDDDHGMLPFFIDWDGSVHPSTDAPKGCIVERFVIDTPDPETLRKTIQRIGIDVPTYRKAVLELSTIIVGPQGRLEATS